MSEKLKPELSFEEARAKAIKKDIKGGKIGIAVGGFLDTVVAGSLYTINTLPTNIPHSGVILSDIALSLGAIVYTSVAVEGAKKIIRTKKAQKESLT